MERNKQKYTQKENLLEINSLSVMNANSWRGNMLSFKKFKLYIMLGMTAI
jgi:hypothetical protein